MDNRNMTNEELMALPEITDLSYDIVEKRDEHGPHDYYTQPRIKVSQSGTELVGLPAYEIYFQFDEALCLYLSYSISAFISRRCNAVEKEDWLKWGRLEGAEYAPYFRRINNEWWTLNQGLMGSTIETEYQDIARVRDDLLLHTVSELEKHYSELLPIPPRQAVQLSQ